MSKITSLADAFYDTLQDMYSAETQVVKVMPKMAKKATCEKLTAAFELQIEQTKIQVERVEKAFKDTGKDVKAKTCEAMKGLIKESESMMEEEADSEVMDAILIALAQKVKHYEIASYGTLCTWAEKLEYTNAKKLLGENLDEEEKTDKALTKLSVSKNQAAMA